MAESENVVGEFRLGKELGRGSFATVFLAEHEQTKEKKAVKKIDRSRLSPKLLQNLESEISILRDFQHENIVKLHGIMKNPSHIFLVLEFCGGGDLHKYIRLKGRLAEVNCLFSFSLSFQKLEVDFIHFSFSKSN
jgi:serine/threonine-protein kinase ULK2